MKPPAIGTMVDVPTLHPSAVYGPTDREEWCGRRRGRAIELVGSGDDDYPDDPLVCLEIGGRNGTLYTWFLFSDIRAGTIDDPEFSLSVDAMVSEHPPRIHDDPCLPKKSICSFSLQKTDRGTCGNATEALLSTEERTLTHCLRGGVFLSSCAEPRRRDRISLSIAPAGQILTAPALTRPRPEGCSTTCHRPNEHHRCVIEFELAETVRPPAPRQGHLSCRAKRRANPETGSLCSRQDYRKSTAKRRSRRRVQTAMGKL